MDVFGVEYKEEAEKYANVLRMVNIYYDFHFFFKTVFRKIIIYEYQNSFHLDYGESIIC